MVLIGSHLASQGESVCQVCLFMTMEYIYIYIYVEGNFGVSESYILRPNHNQWQKMQH